ncbi:MobV family relaxase [Halomonas sp. AOP7-C1-8]|uniref:MobV family relaxase n=1 Tax=unclassified Halomonas TaxID=2609666 RepID=UPI004027E0BD
MAYAIMRGEKRKTGDVRGITAHIARTQPTPNADVSQQHRNYAVVGPAWDDQKGINAAIEARTPKKYRKDAVRAIEYIVSASPEWFEENSDKQAALYFESAVDWFQDEFGADNVVSAVVHNDESSPHMHILVVPLDAETGRLNGKWFFGNKGVLQKRQSKFADHMAPFGVERGKADPQRTHTKVHEWRAGHARLDERDAALKAREFSTDLEKQQLVDREVLLDQREQALAAREQRLAALERELSVRGEKLAGGEKGLEQRQAEIDRAGAVLQQRLAAARAAQQQFEQQKARWIAENRPAVPAKVSPLVQHLKALEPLGVIASAEYLDAHNIDELYELFDPHEGLTERGKALLEQYAGVQKRAEQFDQAFTPSSNTPGL